MDFNQRPEAASIGSTVKGRAGDDCAHRSGDPHSCLQKLGKISETQISGATQRGEPTIGDMNGRHYVSLHAFRRDAQSPIFCYRRLELESAKSGQIERDVYLYSARGRCVAVEKK